jgi:carboxypeptidase C (cathepsin A)
MSDMYSGYLNLAEPGRQLHYVFFASLNDPANDPVVLWLNGGPGCSSMDGLFSENGPLHMDPTNNSRLVFNNETWNKYASMLYLEAPTGVGFSYSENPKDDRTNDTKTAYDNWTALKAFFAAYPEYAKNDFYIAGESYAGVYIPTLAHAIHYGNAAGESNIPLAGIMVGNGCTGTEVGTCSPQGTEIHAEFLWQRGLYSAELHDAIEDACQGQFADPGAACQKLLTQMHDEVNAVNIYNIYAPCIMNFEQPSNPVMTIQAGIYQPGPVGCIDAGAVTHYLNLPEVVEALHVSSTKQYWKSWSICAMNLDYTATATNLPRDVYPVLIENYKVLIFNGDVDACVPMDDNQAWTSGMGYPVAQPWHAWMVDEQVAGYATSYTTQGSGSFAFITVKGAGHMVPQFKPVQALAMMQRFISNTPF